MVTGFFEIWQNTDTLIIAIGFAFGYRHLLYLRKHRSSHRRIALTGADVFLLSGIFYVIFLYAGVFITLPFILYFGIWENLLMKWVLASIILANLFTPSSKNLVFRRFRELTKQDKFLQKNIIFSIIVALLLTPVTVGIKVFYSSSANLSVYTLLLAFIGSILVLSLMPQLVYEFEDTVFRKK